MFLPWEDDSAVAHTIPTVSHGKVGVPYTPCAFHSHIHSLAMLLEVSLTLFNGFVSFLTYPCRNSKGSTLDETFQQPYFLHSWARHVTKKRNACCSWAGMILQWLLCFPCQFYMWRFCRPGACGSHARKGLPGLGRSKVTALSTNRARRGKCPSARIIFDNSRGVRWANHSGWTDCPVLFCCTSAREKLPQKIQRFPPPSLLAGFCMQNYLILHLDKPMS